MPLTYMFYYISLYNQHYVNWEEKYFIERLIDYFNENDCQQHYLILVS